MKPETNQRRYNRWLLGIAIVVVLGTLFFIYLVYYPPKSNESYSRALDSTNVAIFIHRIDSLDKSIKGSTLNAQRSDIFITPDSAKVEVIGSDGKAIVYPIGPPPPPPPSNKSTLDDNRILLLNQHSKKKSVITYDCVDSLDPLPPEVLKAKIDSAKNH